MNKSLIVLILISFFMFSCNNDVEKKEVNQMVKDAFEEMQHGAQKKVLKDGIFIHLSSGPEDPQRVLMALNMAKIMSEDKNVLIYADIKAVHVFLKNAKDITFNQFPNSKDLIKSLLERKVTIMVCPSCLKAAEKKQEELLDGILVANKEKFFNFTKGRIISLDY